MKKIALEFKNGVFQIKPIIIKFHKINHSTRLPITYLSLSNQQQTQFFTNSGIILKFYQKNPNFLNFNKLITKNKIY